MFILLCSKSISVSSTHKVPIAGQDGVLVNSSCRQGGRRSKKTWRTWQNGDRSCTRSRGVAFELYESLELNLFDGPEDARKKFPLLLEPLSPSLPNRVPTALHKPGRARLGKCRTKLYFSAAEPYLHIFARSHRVKCPAHLYRWSKNNKR